MSSVEVMLKKHFIKKVEECMLVLKIALSG
jgi:hypothetical protein